MRESLLYFISGKHTFFYTENHSLFIWINFPPTKSTTRQQRTTKNGDVHKTLTQQDKQNIDHIFSIQSTRVINGDFTIQFKNNWYQLKEIQPTTVRAKEQVTVEEWLDKTIHFTLRGFDLSYLVLPERPARTKKPPAILTTHKLNWKPPLNHPWRKYAQKN